MSICLKFQGLDAERQIYKLEKEFKPNMSSVSDSVPIFKNFYSFLLGHKKKKTNKQTKTTVFYGWTDLPSRVGWSGVSFFSFFFFMVVKTTLKTQYSKKNQTVFAEKFWENILTYFQKFSAKIFRFWSKNNWFYKIWKNNQQRKKTAKMENLGRSRP